MMITAENKQLQDEQPNIRPVINDHIQRKMRRTKLAQWILTGLSFASGAAAAVSHELDTEAWTVAFLSAPVVAGACGAYAQTRARRQTNVMANGYIASLEATAKSDSPQDLSPTDYLAAVSSIGSAAGTVAGPFLSQVMAEGIDETPQTYILPGPITIGGFVLAVGLVSHYAGIELLNAHQEGLMNRMDAAEARVS